MRWQELIVYDFRQRYDPSQTETEELFLEEQLVYGPGQQPRGRTWASRGALAKVSRTDLAQRI